MQQYNRHILTAPRTSCLFCYGIRWGTQILEYVSTDQNYGTYRVVLPQPIPGPEFPHCNQSPHKNWYPSGINNCIRTNDGNAFRFLQWKEIPGIFQYNYVIMCNSTCCWFRTGIRVQISVIYGLFELPITSFIIFIKMTHYFSCLLGNRIIF